MATSSEFEPTSIAIAGGGLAGLCLAQSLLRAGFDVQVYERDSSPQARQQGYRITVDQYGASALKHCLPPKLFEAVLATASSHGDVGYFRFTNQNLGEIFKLTFKHASRHSRAGDDGDRSIGQPCAASCFRALTTGCTLENK